MVLFIKIPDKDFTEIFELLKLAPSCFNIQHSNYLVVTDEEKKEQLRISIKYILLPQLY